MHKTFSILIFLITSLTTVQSFAQGPDFSSQRLTKIDGYFSELIEKGELAGAVSLISKNNQIQHFKSHGKLDIKNSIPMHQDAIIPIGSMTKIITSIAVLQLYEDGKFLLSDRVETYLPEFKNLKVLMDPDTILTEPLNSKPTIRDLLRHTTGMVYSGGSTVTDRLYREAGVRNWSGSLQSFVETVSNIPLEFQPNTDWRYSYSHDILGYLIEVVSGMSLDQFCQKRIFEPLQLKSTGFVVPKDKSKDLATLYKYNEGVLEVDVDRKNSIYLNLPEAISGGGGWWSSYGGVVTTVEEFYKISSMLLNYGKQGDIRILGRKTVELMMANHIGDMDAFGHGYGLGLGVVRSIGESPQVTSAGEVYWAGAPYNTYFWIDYKEKLIGILFTNTAPFGHKQMMDKFKALALQALDN